MLIGGLLRTTVDDERVTLRSSQNMVCDAPEEQIFEPRLAMLAHHD